MANRTIFDTGARIKVSSAKALKAIRDIEDEIRNKALPKATTDILFEAQSIAQETLTKFNAPKSTSQQLSPKEAVDEIGVKINNKGSGYIYAPINEGSRNSMYFLEYGAGIHNERGTSHTNGEPWKYPIKHGETDIHREVEPKEAHDMRYGKGFFKLGDQAVKYQNQYGNWWGVTKTSKPVRYMASARRYILWNAKPKAIASINLAIQNHAKRKQYGETIEE